MNTTDTKIRVMLKGGPIGSKASAGKEFDDVDDAKKYAKRMNKLLSPGEKKYYGLRYVVILPKKQKN